MTSSSKGSRKNKRFLILWNRIFQDGGNTLAHVLAHPSLDSDCDSLANAREARADLISVRRDGQVGFRRSPGEARRYWSAQPLNLALIWEQR